MTIDDRQRVTSYQPFHKSGGAFSWKGMPVSVIGWPYIWYMWKKIVTDPSLWVLLIFNIYLYIFYRENPTEFATVVYLYWTQSVLIGLLNFINLLTIPKIKPGSMTINGTPAENGMNSKGCIAFFFLFHYGFFHLGYLVFLIVKFKFRIDHTMFMVGLGILTVNLLMEFIRKKMEQQGKEVNIGTVFFQPYLRIVPMHLMILLPAFTNISDVSIFIFLKILMDLIMHFITTDRYRT